MARAVLADFLLRRGDVLPPLDAGLAAARDPGDPAVPGQVPFSLGTGRARSVDPSRPAWFAHAHQAREELAANIANARRIPTSYGSSSTGRARHRTRWSVPWRALRLDADERGHLYRLAGLQPRRRTE